MEEAWESYWHTEPEKHTPSFSETETRAFYIFYAGQSSIFSKHFVCFSVIVIKVPQGF